ncbi:MAG: HAD-IA family hydrolase [Gammaproteobacteria bacterium]|nr:HAD-IA family hydrolase [Gammaproteobacteria bacterium]
MIEAILWDFGGVLTSSPFESFNQFEQAHGIPKDFIRGVNATHPETNAWAQFESNQVSLDEFDDLFRAESEAKGHAIGGKQVIELLSGEVRPRMIHALKICKAHFSVGCITNNIKSGKGPGMASTDERAARVAEVMELFDVIVESSVEGVRKPDPKIYAIACKRMNVQPANAVFIDDLGINLKPARAMGMATIKVVTQTQAIDELTAVTGLAF